MARTTLDIDTPVLKELRRLQKKEKAKSLGRLVSDLLADALARYPKREGSVRSFSWNSQKMRPLVDLADKEQVYSALDEPER